MRRAKFLRTLSRPTVRTNGTASFHIEGRFARAFTTPAGTLSPTCTIRSLNSGHTKPILAASDWDVARTVVALRREGRTPRRYNNSFFVNHSGFVAKRASWTRTTRGAPEKGGQKFWVSTASYSRLRTAMVATAAAWYRAQQG